MKFRGIQAAAPSLANAKPAPEESYGRSLSLRPEVRDTIIRAVFDRINTDATSRVERDQLVEQLETVIGQVASERRLQLNRPEQHTLALQIADDMLGVGPLEPLMRDDGITDIMVNGPGRVFIEKGGKIVKTDITFRDEAHLRTVAQRMARFIGRRLDEASPMVDARLPNGSRVNIVVPPIALDGTTISIRKFSRQEITLETLVRFNSISDKMKTFFEIAGMAQLNILISGGTSSGKTTLLNALSRGISDQERIITIEDSAELKLQQPHVVRLETRPKQIDSHATEISQRELVANALRMRPDRIILGEVRQGEAFDLIQAMNTGHAAAGTLHANSPRDALARVENMVLMAGFELPVKAIRTQIASAVNLIIQAERCVDGVRRVTRVTEVTGIEGDIISTQDLFSFETKDNKGGVLRGEFVCSNVNLRCLDKVKRFGLHNELRRLFAGTGL